MTTRPLSPNAERLLDQLRVGSNVAVPSPVTGSMAYSSFAQAYFSNAQSLCREDHMSDFRVYGVLYLLRHGLELMLKCIIRNNRIDEILHKLHTPGLSFNDACNELALRRQEADQLRRSTCVMRNILEYKIPHPRCLIENMDSMSTEQSLDFLRRTPDTSRECFAQTWTGGEFGHDLAELWEKAAPTVSMFEGDAQRHAFEIGYPSPLTSTELEPIVALLSALDNGGDGFRYPSSMSGEWYPAAPSLSLEAVCELVEKLEDTCVVFESMRTECYSMSTVGHPTPQYRGEQA